MIFIPNMHRCPLHLILSTASVRHVPADAGFLCDNALMLGDTIKGTHSFYGILNPLATL
jgi:hypothetical protein